MRKTIHVTLTVKVPRVPNFLQTNDGQSVPLYAVTDGGLRALGELWIEDLIANSHRMKKESSREG